MAPTPPPSDIRGDATPPPFSAQFGLMSDSVTTNSMPLPSFPEARVVRISVSGKITGIHKYGAEPNRNVGPYGYGNCASTVSVYYSNQEVLGPLPSCGSTADTMVRPAVRVQGSGVVTRGGAQDISCQNPISGAWENCWRWDGQQQVSVEVVDVTATLYSWNGSYKTTLSAPGYLWFNWVLDAGFPSNTPVETMNWWFVSSDGTTNNPISYGYNNQSWWVPKSGTMYVKVKLNGTVKTLSRYIHVGPATLTLVADRTKVYPGEPVEFTARILPETTSVSSLRWFWFPEQSGGIALRSSSDSVISGSAMRAASISQTTDSIEVGSCAGYPSCTYTPSSRGGMRVHATVGAGAKKADLDIDWRSARFQLLAKPKRAIKGRSVRFTASAMSQGGAAIQFGVSQWTWQESNGMSSEVCTPGYIECTLSPLARSGTMRAIATINGMLDTAYAPVDVFDCDTTGVPELDDLDMRDSLDAWYGRRRSLLREGLVIIDAAEGGGFNFLELNTPQARLCSTGATSPANVGIELMDGLMIHPHFPEQGMPGELLPLQCRSILECAWRQDADGGATILGDCSPPSRRVENIPDPAGQDWGRNPGWPERQAIFRADSVIGYNSVDDWMSKRSGVGATFRKQVGNWRACLANRL